jgi:hypothetical protein
MTIQYVPWEDKEKAQEQLAAYVTAHPDAKFYFDSHTSRPDTAYLKDADENVAEISLKFIEEAIAENDNIGDGVSFRDVIKSTRELNPDFFEKEKEEEVEEVVPLSAKLNEYSTKHKKIAWTAAAVITLILTFTFGSIIMSSIFGESDPVYEMTEKDYNQILNDAEQRLLKIKELRKKSKDFAEYQAKELHQRLTKLDKDALSKENQNKLKDLIMKTGKYITTKATKINR